MRCRSKKMYSLDDGMTVPQEWIVNEAKREIALELMEKLPFNVYYAGNGDLCVVELDIDVYDAKEFRKKLFGLLNDENNTDSYE